MTQDQRGSSQPKVGSSLSAQSGLLEVYLHDIGQIPLLSAAQEVELGEAIREGQAALNELGLGQATPQERHELWQRVARGQSAECHMIEANLRLVVSIANRYAYSAIPFVDLIQEGNLGLLKAVQRFDSRLHYRFSTYATYWIRQTIGRLVAEGGRMVRLPSHVAETMSRLRTVSAALSRSLGRQPSLDELTLSSTLLSTQDTRAVREHLDSGAPMPIKLQRRWDRSREQVRTILDFMADPISLGKPISDDNDALMEEIVASQESGPDEQSLEHVLNDSVTQALGCLSTREQCVLKQRYGLGDIDTKTLEQIGQQLGVTRERVRQIEKRALQKLRQSSRARGLKLFLAS